MGRKVKKINEPATHNTSCKESHGNAIVSCRLRRGGLCIVRLLNWWLKISYIRQETKPV